MISKSDREELARLHASATPGPLHWETVPGHDGPRVPQGSYLGTTLITLGDTYEGSTVDCLLLELARNALPALLAAAEFAEKAEAFLSEHGHRLHDACSYSSWERDVGKDGANATRLALAALLRALPERKDGDG